MTVDAYSAAINYHISTAFEIIALTNTQTYAGDLLAFEAHLSFGVRNSTFNFVKKEKNL